MEFLLCLVAVGAASSAYLFTRKIFNALEKSGHIKAFLASGFFLGATLAIFAAAIAPLRFPDLQGLIFLFILLLAAAGAWRVSRETFVAMDTYGRPSRIICGTLSFIFTFIVFALGMSVFIPMGFVR